jgi:hypothetical protein
MSALSPVSAGHPPIGSGPHSGFTGERFPNSEGTRQSTVVIKTGIGFRSEACVAKPSLCASMIVDPPPQNGSTITAELSPNDFLISARASSIKDLSL